MMQKVSFSKDKIKELAAEGKLVSAMAEEIGADPDELAIFYAKCYKEDRHAFPLRLLVTKPWLEEKLQTDTISKIAKSLGVSQKPIRSIMNVYGLEKNTITNKLTPEVLFTLFVEKGLTDREIAQQYGCSIELLKKLRSKYKIGHDSRNGILPELSIEMFHKLYVEYGFSIKNISTMSGRAPSQTLRVLSEYEKSDHPLAKELKGRKRTYAYAPLIKIMLEQIEPSVFYELMKNHTLAEVAEMYEIIPQPEPEVKTFTSDWMKIILGRYDIKETASVYHIGMSFVHELMDEQNLKAIPRPDRIDEKIVRSLFIDSEWSDEKIAKSMNTSAKTIKKVRMRYNITPDQRKKLHEKLDADRFAELYLQEGLSLTQIAKLFNVSAPVISKLRDQYAKENPELSNHRAPGVTPQRLTFIKKQMKIKEMKK